MTEAEWMGGDDPVPMLGDPAVPQSDRRERLVACACCRRLWNFLAAGSQRAIEATELYADGKATSDDLWVAYHVTEGAINFFGHVNGPVHRLTFPDDQFDVFKVVDHAAEAVDGEKGRASESAAQAKIVREVFGNPFSPISINPNWLTPTVSNLARAAYEKRALLSGELDTTRLAILADALEEAGCDNQEILNHLRSPGPHRRGCFALDLVLGRS